MRATLTWLTRLDFWNYEYTSDDVQADGWYSSTVLLICLPVFLTLLAYAGILFYEVAAKKELISNRPITINTTATKYTDPNPQLANPPGTTGTLATNLPVNNPQHAPLPLDINNQNPQVVQTAPVVVEKDTTIEPYLWEELLVYFVFHLVALVFCIHPAQISTNQNVLSIVIAWLHFAYICGYSFVAVIPS